MLHISNLCCELHFDWTCATCLIELECVKPSSLSERFYRWKLCMRATKCVSLALTAMCVFNACSAVHRCLALSHLSALNPLSRICGRLPFEQLHDCKIGFTWRQGVGLRGCNLSDTSCIEIIIIIIIIITMSVRFLFPAMLPEIIVIELHSQKKEIFWLPVTQSISL